MNQQTRRSSLPKTPPRAWLERTDRELVTLARGAGALRLELGDGLSALRETGGHLELGFPTVGAYAVERLGRRRRWAEDTARVALQLTALPQTRAALAVGDITWSTAELLARAATPGTEAALLADAKALTFRALRAKLRGAALAVAAAVEPEEAPRRTLQVTVERVTAWAYELTRRFVHAMNGSPSDDSVVEALLAEALITLQHRHPDLEWPDPSDDACARADAWRAHLDALRGEAEIAAEPRIRGRDGDLDRAELHALIAALVGVTTGEGGESGEDDSPRAGGSNALDQHLRALSTKLLRHDRNLGEVARALWDCDGWYYLGYASATQYAHERLGVSRSSLDARMNLARGCARLPEVAQALDAGEIGFEAARLVTRVAHPSTVRDWLDRAAQRTVKHLGEEVAAVESIASANGELHARLEPPDDETLNGFLDLERAMLDGRVTELVVRGGQLSGDDRTQMSGDDPAQLSGDDTAQMSGDDPAQLSGDDPAQMSGDDSAQMSGDDPAQVPPSLRRGAGRVPLRLRLRDDLVHFWRDVERGFSQAGEAGEFADFLIRTFWHTWLLRDPDPTARVAYQHIYERERFRCASPVCTNRDLTPHHLVFRSRGGGDEDDNVLGLCVTCHLELLHQGRVTAAPPADHVLWTLGRRPLIVVDGRKRQL